MSSLKLITARKRYHKYKYQIVLKVTDEDGEKEIATPHVLDIKSNQGRMFIHVHTVGITGERRWTVDTTVKDIDKWWEENGDVVLDWIKLNVKKTQAHCEHLLDALQVGR